MPIGGYLPMDKNGFLINDTSFERVTPTLLPLIADIITSFQKQEKDKLHSVWLRGSVARGNFVENISDIDFFALVFEPNIHWKKASWAEKTIKKLKHYYSFTQEIELNVSSYYTDFYQQNPRLSFILKTQSLCLFGQNIQEQVPRFQISNHLTLNSTWLEEDIRFFEKIKSPDKKEIQEILKIIIRSSFELVMLREKKYTSDLYWCIHSFGKYYPEKIKSAWQLLDCFIGNFDISDTEKIKKDILSFGNWLLVEKS